MKSHNGKGLQREVDSESVEKQKRRATRDAARLRRLIYDHQIPAFRAYHQFPHRSVEWCEGVRWYRIEISAEAGPV